jgi:hypothetical protein
MGFRDDHDGGAMPCRKARQHGEVPSKQGSRFETLDAVVFVHGHQTVNHQQRRSGDVQLAGQTMQLTVQLMQGKSSTQVQAS